MDERQIPPSPRFQGPMRIWLTAKAFGWQSALQPYLEDRGLWAPKWIEEESPLQAHPGLTFRLPRESETTTISSHAMVALITAPNGEVVGIHRTALTAVDGRFVKNMQINGEAEGAAIRLAPAAKILGIAEGIENAMAAMAGSGIPTWAAGSAVMLANFVPPEETDTVIIWADKDKNGVGLKLARQLRRRLKALGKTVEIRVPALRRSPNASIVDWNDVLQQVGPSGFTPKRAA